MRKFVEFNDVYKRYKMGEVTINAANGISFGIEEGEFAIVVGPSGAGKTTVLNILGGMSGCDEGQVFVGDKEVSSLSARELATYRRYDTGFVFQFYNLIQNLTAVENVELATQICKDPMDARETLASVGLEDRMDNFPSQLSGGEQQRVVIARAIINNPSILICDEPTGNLDPVTSRDIMRILEEINKHGTTVVVVTHDSEMVNIMKKRVLTLENGYLTSDDVKGRYRNAK